MEKSSSIFFVPFFSIFILIPFDWHNAQKVAQSPRMPRSFLIKEWKYPRTCIRWLRKIRPTFFVPSSHSYVSTWFPHTVDNLWIDASVSVSIEKPDDNARNDDNKIYIKKLDWFRLLTTQPRNFNFQRTEKRQSSAFITLLLDQRQPETNDAAGGWGRHLRWDKVFSLSKVMALDSTKNSHSCHQ